MEHAISNAAVNLKNLAELVSIEEQKLPIKESASPRIFNVSKRKARVGNTGSVRKMHRPWLLAYQGRVIN